MVKMIERYTGFVFEGGGRIIDHRDCNTIIEFKFKSSDNELAKRVCEKCLECLNDRE